MNFTGPPGATPLDPDEAAGLLPSSISNQGELNAFEQANVLDAELWALSRKRKSVLTDTFIRALHRRMFGQVWRWAGRYRTTDKNIGVPWTQIPIKVVALCGDATHWLQNRTFPWHELAARFHHRLVSIHPFANGNGRHARLMTEVLLFNNDQTLPNWGEGNLAHTGRPREQYIAALQAADANDYAPLIAFLAE